MANLEELEAIRLKKLKRIIAAGYQAYPAKSWRTHQVAEVLKDFSKLKKGKKEIILAGRLMALRIHGGVIFGDLEDGSAKMQFLLRKDGVGEKKFEFFKEVFDIGDFIEIKGFLMKTKAGEKTLEVSDLRMLSKSLLPLPEKWHGLKDVEERFRKRHLDLIFNKEVKKKFGTRAKIIGLIRDFLDKKGFLEVETPILQPVYGGARAKPFKTHLNALKMDLYLRISPELYLKRLIVGGLEKVYEIGKCFRNEGIDRQHNPDFTMLEFYWAYADDKDLMKLVEELFVYLLTKIFKKTTISYEGQTLDFKTPWPRIEFNNLFEKYTHLKLEEIKQEGLYKKALALGLKVPPEMPKAEISDEIYKKYCRLKIVQPTFVIHHPLGFQTLAKQYEKDPNKLLTLQLVVAGMEIINAFAELNDPLEQERRFKEQEKLREKGLPEAQMMDKDFLEALKQGMPPTAGLGMGIDRLTALLTDSHSLREVILFPAMKTKS